MASKNAPFAFANMAQSGSKNLTGETVISDFDMMDMDAIAAGERVARSGKDTRHPDPADQDAHAQPDTQEHDSPTSADDQKSGTPKASAKNKSKSTRKAANQKKESNPEDLLKSVSARASSLNRRGSKVNFDLPSSLYHRLVKFEETVLDEHSLVVVRVSLLNRAIAEVQEDGMDLGEWLLDPTEMQGEGVPFTTRVTKEDQLKIWHIRKALRQEDKSASMRMVVCAALNRFLTTADRELSKVRSGP